MMFATVGVGRVVASADIIAEYIIVQAGRADKPIDDFVDFVIAPFSAHIGPPAKRDAPSLELMPLCARRDDIGTFVENGSLRRVVRQIPVVGHLLVGISPRTGDCVVNADILVVCPATQGDIEV